MHLHRYYRKESNPEFIRAAEAAYREAPPTHNSRTTGFARTVNRADRAATPEVGRADTVEAD